MSSEITNLEGAHEEILQLLYQKGDLSSTNLRILKNYMKEWGGSGFTAILDCNLLSECGLADSLAKHLALERVHNLASKKVAPDVLKRISFDKARLWQCLPLELLAGQDPKLKIAMADPTNKSVIELMRKEVRCDFILAVGERRDILAAVDLESLNLQIPGGTRS